MTRRALWPSRLFRTQNATPARPAAAPISSGALCRDPQACVKSCRCFAQVKDFDCPTTRQVWFNSSAPRTTSLQPSGSDHKPPSERTIQLGRTVRILHERLPTLLKEPLPSEVLSPQISLHLFPSTHPHLPTVSGRIAYVAALWTAPVAWGRLPLIGNVNLSILSERMVRNGPASRECGGDEKLIVKWKTCGKTTHRDGSGGIYRGIGIGAKDPVEKIRDFIAGTKGRSVENAPEAEEFCGIFIFEFDEQGRIAKHVIEHTEEGGQWDHMTRVVSVTDWLIGTFNGKRKQEPALAWYSDKPVDGDLKMLQRKRGD